jgi:hypothetical protein
LFYTPKSKPFRTGMSNMPQLHAVLPHHGASSLFASCNG